MTFHIVSEIIGVNGAKGGRMRIRAARPLTAALTQFFAVRLEEMPGITGVRGNRLTGSFAFFYADGESRMQALLLFADEKNIPDPEDLPAVEPEDETPALGGFLPLVRYLFLRPFLPPLLRMVNATVNALPFIAKGVGALARGRLSVDVLDASAITASLCMRDYRTVSMLTLLLGLGDTLAYWTRRHSLESLTESLSLHVESVWRVADGVEVATPLSEIKKNDIIVVRAGTGIPADGIVVKGTAVVNQASMTGEPIGVKREKGGTVFAGTTVEEGEIFIRVTKVGDDTRFRQIAAFIEESEALKAGIQGKSERMADMAVPFTFGLAALVWFFTRDIVRAASVLLVDYSCALKLATPLAVLATMREGAYNGMVIKGGRYIEALSEADTLVFDKTGTLTNASPVVAEVIPCGGRSRDDVLRIMACLEEHFPHPVARAVVNKAAQKKLIHEEEHAQVEYIVAHGLCSSLNGKRLLVGSRHYVECDEGIDISPLEERINEQAELGRSLLYLAEDGMIAGMIAIEDPLRPEAPAVIRAMRNLGFRRVVMLTGDDERTARAIAARAGVDEYHAQILPADKSTIVQQMTDRGCKVLMVGDGINDAPALSASHVGVAMIDGTDLAREVANVLLTTPDLNGLVTARRLADSTMRRIRTNFAATLILNSLFLAGGLFRVLPASTSAVLHNLTTLGISMNAMRPHLRPLRLPFCKGRGED